MVIGVWEEIEMKYLLNVFREHMEGMVAQIGTQNLTVNLSGFISVSVRMMTYSITGTESISFIVMDLVTKVIPKILLNMMVLNSTLRDII